MGMHRLTEVLADTPDSELGNLLAFDFDLGAFLLKYPWVLLIPVLAVWLGIHFGWKKLQMAYRMQGKPLRSLGTILKESFSVMYREDTYPVLQFNQAITAKTAWFTWVFYWKWVTLFTLVIIPLAVLGLISGWVLVGTLAAVVFLWLMGISHVKGVFGIRMHRLMQMFNVASSEARYESGAVVDLFSYVQVQGWEDVYHPQRVVVMFPTKYKSEEQRNRISFETNFSGSVTDQNSWAYTWESTQNRVICDPVPFIPATAPYPFPDQSPWNIFPLGLSSNGEEATWDVSASAHMLVAGTTGSGKSVTQRTILLHALQNPKWRIVLIDPKRVELSVYASHPHVLKSVTELTDAVALLEQLVQELESRYKQMTELGNAVNYFEMLDNPPPAILLMIDETFELLSPSGIKSEEGKEIDALKARAGILIGSLARLGRAAGIHMVLATQRPDAKVLPGEVKANLAMRIAQGRMDKIPSLMTLDSDAATKLPKIKGRAVYRSANGDQLEFQAYFLAPEHLPEVLEMSAAIAQGNTDFIAAESDPAITDEAPQVEFVENRRLPKIKNPFAKLMEWVEKREAAIEADNIRAGRTEEDRAKRDELRAEVASVPEPKFDETGSNPPEKSMEQQLQELSSMANDIKTRNNLPPLFEDPKPKPPIDAELLRQPVASDDEFSGDPSLDDWDEDDLYDSWVDDDEEWITPQQSLPEPQAPVQETPTVVDDPVGYVDDLTDDSEYSVVSPQHPANAGFTVQDVIARAAERGAPIPASELLAALQSEASAVQSAMPTPNSLSRPVQKQDAAVSETGTERETASEAPSLAQLPKVIAAPPGQSIPAPPTGIPAAKTADHSELDSDIEGMATQDNDTPRLNPLSAPWIPSEPVQWEETNSPFGDGGIKKPSDSPEEKARDRKLPQRPKRS